MVSFWVSKLKNGKYVVEYIFKIPVFIQTTVESRVILFSK